MPSHVPQRLHHALRRFITGAGLAVVTMFPVTLPAQTYLTETFSGVPDSQIRLGQTSAIPGTGVKITNGIAEVVNDQTTGRGRYLWMRLGWYGLSYDPVTNLGTAKLEAVNKFDLFAGVTYTLKFDWSRQGFSAGNGPFPFSFDAMLGSAKLTFSDAAGFFFGENWSTGTLTFTPTATELGATLAFAGTGFAYSGFYIDNISMAGVPTSTPPTPPTTPPTPGVVPEPSTWALMSTGLLLLGAQARRRKGAVRTA